MSHEFRAQDCDYDSIDDRVLYPFQSSLEPRRYLISDLILQIAETVNLDIEESKAVLCKAIWEHHLLIDLEVSIPSGGIISILGWQFGELDIEGVTDAHVA